LGNAAMGEQDRMARLTRGEQAGVVEPDGSDDSGEDQEENSETFHARASAPPWSHHGTPPRNAERDVRHFDRGDLVAASLMAASNRLRSAGLIPWASSWATNSLILPSFIASDKVKALESLTDFPVCH
jgi:hypothetical protein